MVGPSCSHSNRWLHLPCKLPTHVPIAKSPTSPLHYACAVASPQNVVCGANSTTFVGLVFPKLAGSCMTPNRQVPPAAQDSMHMALRIFSAHCMPCYAGVQIATNAIDEALKAAVMAEEAGASWIDLNCGCPIYGAALNDDPWWLGLRKWYQGLVGGLDPACCPYACSNSSLHNTGWTRGAVNSCAFLLFPGTQLCSACTEIEVPPYAILLGLHSRRSPSNTWRGSPTSIISLLLRRAV